MPRSWAILAISLTTASVNTRSAPVEPNQLLVLGDQRVLRLSQDSGEVFNSRDTQACNYWQPADQLVPEVT